MTTCRGGGVGYVFMGGEGRKGFFLLSTIDVHQLGRRKVLGRFKKELDPFKTC